MQSQIEILQGQLKERSNDTQSITNSFPNFDDPQWMLSFMDELKNRTMRGTSNLFFIHERCDPRS